MKRLLIVIVALTSMLLPVAVFAQGSGCQTCSAAPAELQKYITTMVKLINLIPVGSTAEAEAGSGAAIPLADTAAGKKAQALAVYTEIMYGGIGLGHMFEDIELILDGSVRARDAISLQSLDTMLSKRISTAFSVGTLTDFIPNDVYIQIDQTFKELEYVKLAKKNNGQYVMQGQSAQYKDYAKLLRSYNKIYKSLHNEHRMANNLKEMNSGYDVIYTDKPQDAKETAQKEQLALATKYVKQLTDRYLIALTNGRTGKNTDWLEFTNDQREFFLSIWAIHDDYVCATGVITSCEESRGSRKETAEHSWNQVKDVRKNRGGSAINTFKRARADLKDSFGKGSDRNKEGRTQRENHLLHSIYGKDIPSKHKWWNNPGGPGLPFDIDAQVDAMPVGVQATKEMIIKGYKYAGQKLSKKKTASETTSSSDPDKTAKSGSEENENLADTPAKRAGLFDKFKKHLDDTKKNAWTTEDQYSGLLQDIARKQDKVRSFQETYASVINLQYEMQNQAILIDTNVVTKRMPMLSAAVHKNMNDLGGKGDRGMIYNSMGQVCEIQCENVGGRCRYDSD